MSKFKDLIKNVLTEAKQVGLLYHSTRLDNAIEILEQNKLFAVRDIGISTSRHLRNPYSADNQVTFVLDGDKLSNKYKLEPFEYPGVTKADYETVIQTNKHAQNIYDYRKTLTDLFNNEQDESEVVIDGSTLNNITSYLTEIIVNLNQINLDDPNIQKKLTQLKSISPIPVGYAIIRDE